MGLKVGYTFEFRGSKAELMKKIKGLKSRFEGLPVTSVGEIEDIERAYVELGPGSEPKGRYIERLLGLTMVFTYFELSVPEKTFGDMAWRIGGTAHAGRLKGAEKRRYERLRRKAREIRDRRADKIVQSGNGLALTVDVGEGCEHFLILLGRLGNGEVWRGAYTTKTQYAEHFVPCHLTVIDMLDMCKEAGILKKVADDGEYWETRDLNLLGKNMNISTERIQAIVAAFKKPAEKNGFVVCAPIEQSANYVRTGKRSGTRRQSSPHQRRKHGL